MSGIDWIPNKEQDLVDLTLKWTAYLAQGLVQAQYGWDQAECAAAVQKIAGFSAARQAYKETPTSGNRLLKDEAKDQMVDSMRDFAAASIRHNKKVPDNVKVELIRHLPDRVPTHHGRPASQPELLVENTKNHFEHRVYALNAEGEPSKPAGAHGVHYVWQYGGEKPASGGVIRGTTQFSRRTSIIVIHGEEHKAETVYYSACYESPSGEKGPWAPVADAVIG